MVEPFAGGLAVALGLSPQRALLNDINSHLINFYRWLQDGLVVESEFRNDEDFYYRMRLRFNSLISSGLGETKQAAELFYYLNRTGYNGLCRFNKRGQFNVPFGRYKAINYTSSFLEYQPLLGQWEFSCVNYASLDIDSRDLVYADPPYDVEFTAYSNNSFGWDEQVELAHWLRDLEAPVIASNQATNRVVELYSDLGFEVRTINAPRRIACNGDRRPALELLATLRL